MSGRSADARVGGGEPALTVLIADDQPMVRTGLRVILEAHGFVVAAEAADGEAAVSEARRVRPDVCLLDIRMPRLDGLAVTRLLAGPAVPDPMAVVVVTTFDHDAYVREALAAGASGFILKDAGPGLLVEAVRAAARGDALISPSITVRFLRHFAAEEAGRRQPPQPLEALSEREEEVLRLVGVGRTNNEIAATLHISTATAKSHLNHLSTKIGARNRVELAAWAWDTGRMSGDPDAPPAVS